MPYVPIIAECTPSPHTRCKARRQYGAAPSRTASLDLSVPARKSEKARSAVRYAATSAYRVPPTIVYAPAPTTCCSRPPSISVAALGATATLDDANGNPHAGVVL